MTARAAVALRAGRTDEGVRPYVVRCCPPVRRLVVKAVAEFDVDFAGIVPMESAEGDAVVEFDAAVGDVQRVQRRGEAFAEIFAQRQIKRSVPRQMVAGIRLAGESVAEARAIVQVGGSVSPPGKR